MADIDVSIYYNEDRIEAMSRILHSQGLDLKTAIQEQIDALYVKVVPEQERSEIDAKIALEHAQRMKELEASRRFAVVHLHDAQNDYHFISELHTSFLQSARLYRMVLHCVTFHELYLITQHIQSLYYNIILRTTFALLFHKLLD